MAIRQLSMNLLSQQTAHHIRVLFQYALRGADEKRILAAVVLQLLFLIVREFRLRGWSQVTNGSSSRSHGIVIKSLRYTSREAFAAPSFTVLQRWNDDSIDMSRVCLDFEFTFINSPGSAPMDEKPVL